MRRQTKNWKRGVALLLSAMMLAGCGSTGAGTSTSGSTEAEVTQEAATTAVAETATSDHAPLTMTTRSTSDYDEFIAALHEAYPEVNIELISYAGANTTGYSNVQLTAGDISDIFVMSYPPTAELQQENLLDLSGEDFISNINLKVISDLSIDGAVYLLPTRMTLFAVYYNKTLFEEHGWAVPNSLAEVRELIPEIEAAGVKVADTCTQYAGATFSYFWDVNAGDEFTTLDGIRWMQDYLAGTATAKGNLEPAVARVQELVDEGVLTIGETDDSDTVAHFQEGNTAFLISNSSQRFTENEDGTGDEYGFIPYLSEDGSNNIVVTNMSMYVGVSKAVQDDPQKYEDAMKVMSFLSTPEGQATMVTNENTVSPIKGEGVDEDSPLYEMSQLIDAGQYMGFVYSGWEDYVVNMGEAMRGLISGETTADEFIETLDTMQEEMQSQGTVPSVATVEENLDKEQVAQLVGTAYAKAVGADCALISIGDYHGAGFENKNGVNARIYKDEAMTADTVCTFNPLNWSNPIQTMTLTGAQIKQYVEEGYFCKEDPTPFEYVLVAPEGFEPEDDTTYTVAVVTESESRAAEGGLTATELIGQDVLVDYITSLGTINTETILWK